MSEIVATAPREEPTGPKTIEDVPGSMFDPAVVRATGIRQLKEMEDRHNFNRQQHFLLAVANWERNFYEKGRRGPLPHPPLALHYIYVETETSNDPKVVEGPDFVADPYSPPVVPTLPEGVVGFGLPTDDGTGGYWVGPTNTVEPGTHAMKDDKEFVFVIIGRLGTLVYRKLWIPVSGR